jgi:DNA-directed RNA polymerase subunit M/transcription elongation factor TFIIS
MKFSTFKCPECGNNDLEVYNSLIDYSEDPAIGLIAFVCIECGHEFEEEMEAVVEV